MLACMRTAALRCTGWMDKSGSAVSAGGTDTVAGSSVVSEVATARIESSRPKRAAASGPKSYTEEI